uniref:Homeobox protein 2-like n=1 Tax=Rhabditophanes sp. KR3021 TaxID=114890 RepID=A0AC35TJ14_9BILA
MGDSSNERSSIIKHEQKVAFFLEETGVPAIIAEYFIRAHGPQYETWNQVRTETLLDDPAVYNKEDKYNSPAAKSVQWKPDLEERLTVSSWSSYSEDQESLYRNDSTYNEHPPRVYGLPKETFNPLPTQSPTNQQTYQQPPPNITPYQPTFIKQPSSSIYSDSKKPYHVTSPTSSYQTDATRRSLDRSQSPGIAILRQQKIITTQSVPEPQYKVDENMGRISRLDGYKHGDLRIRPLSIETESRNYSPTRDDLGRNEKDYERRSGERFDDTNSDTRSGGRGCDRRGGDRSLDRNYDRNRSLGPNYDRSLDRVYDRSLDRNYDRSLDRNYNRSLDRVYDRSSDTNYESNRERSSNNARHPSPNNDPRKSRSEQSKSNYGARARSPSWEEHNANDLYITKDALGNVVDLV